MRCFNCVLPLLRRLAVILLLCPAFLCGQFDFGSLPANARAAAPPALGDLAGVWEVVAGPPARVPAAEADFIRPGSRFVLDPARHWVSVYYDGPDVADEAEYIYIYDQAAPVGPVLQFSRQGHPVLDLRQAGDGSSLYLRSQGREYLLRLVERDIGVMRDIAGLGGVWEAIFSTLGSDINSGHYVRVSVYPPRLGFIPRWAGSHFKEIPVSFKGDPQAGYSGFNCNLLDSHLQEHEFSGSVNEEGLFVLQGENRQTVELARGAYPDMADPDFARLDGYWAVDREESKKYMAEIPEGGPDDYALFHLKGLTPTVLAFTNLSTRPDDPDAPWNYNELVTYLPIKILDASSFSLDYGSGGARLLTLLDENLLQFHYVEMEGRRLKSTTDAVLRRVIDCRNP